jgi:flagellar FliL protein
MFRDIAEIGNHMSDAEPETEDPPPKKSKMPLIIGLVLALIGGGGGFYATWSGMILADESAVEVVEEEEFLPSPEVAFVEMDQIVISLPKSASAKHLMFRAQLEVPENYEADVKKLLPRVVDVLNGYLRALEPADMAAPSALARLRAQMLRRIQVVAGQERVNDLLVMEFVLN